jgi:hypothetical protein
MATLASEWRGIRLFPGKDLIPGNAKVAHAGTSIDISFGPLHEGWDLDAMRPMPTQVPDAPHANEICCLWRIRRAEDLMQAPRARTKLGSRPN